MLPGQPRPFPATWLRHWGAQLIAINLLYAPGYADPPRNRYPNYVGIFSQGEGFVPMGIYHASFGLLLPAAYLRVQQIRAAV